MLLTPPQEAALLAVLCTGLPTPADMTAIRSVQIALLDRAAIRERYPVANAKDRKR